MAGLLGGLHTVLATKVAEAERVADGGEDRAIAEWPAGGGATELITATGWQRSTVTHGVADGDVACW